LGEAFHYSTTLGKCIREISLSSAKASQDNGKGKETLFTEIPCGGLCGGEKENWTRPVLRSSYAQGGPLEDFEVSN